MRGEPFEQYVQKAVLGPLGMRKAAFELTPELRRDLAHATMWTLDGRTFEAPTFPLGTSPAGNLYATVNDLGRFLSVLFATGRGPSGSVLKPETLRAMWKPQLVGDQKTGFGLGFMVGELDGRRTVGHSGAVYGFATELLALPDEKLGVAVVATKDCANAVSRRIGHAALRAMVAARDGKARPTTGRTRPVDPDLARRLAGRYGKDHPIDLLERRGRLFLRAAGSLAPVELGRLGDTLVVDDPVNVDPGTVVEPRGDRVA